MSIIRLAKEGETTRQKELWKLCFGDSDSYINFFYAERYKKDETAVLLHDQEISAMLTMIPVKIMIPDTQGLDSVMFYAIATHPNYQNRGFATQLIDFCNQYLRVNNKVCSILVPANKQLFDFYRKQGYKDGFYIRETLFTRDMIDTLPACGSSEYLVSSINSQGYNQRRNNQLNGRLYVQYAERDIAYQKKLSQQSGADIYGIDCGAMQGCAAIERLNADKVFIKEILLPDKAVNGAIKQIARQLPAKEYTLRIPAYLGGHLGGSIRPFGMIRGLREIELTLISDGLGYLGFAFD